MASTQFSIESVLVKMELLLCDLFGIIRIVGFIYIMYLSCLSYNTASLWNKSYRRGDILSRVFGLSTIFREREREGERCPLSPDQKDKHHLHEMRTISVRDILLSIFFTDERSCSREAPSSVSFTSNDDRVLIIVAWQLGVSTTNSKQA